MNEWGSQTIDTGEAYWLGTNEFVKCMQLEVKTIVNTKFNFTGDGS